MITKLIIEFRNGDTSKGYHIGLYHNEKFEGSIMNLDGYMGYAGKDHEGNNKVTYIGLLKECGKKETVKAIYPIENVEKVYEEK